MQPPFDPRPYQPLMPFFDIAVGNISSIFDGPTIPLSMTVSWLEGQNFVVSMVLNDLDGKKVEQTVVQNATCKFQFGYLGSTPYKSKWYNIFGAKITTKMGRDGYRVMLAGPLLGATQGMTSSNASAGTIKEILDKLATDHNITVTYNPPFGPSYMTDSGYNNNGDTDIQEKQHIKYSHETDMRFVERILTYARDDQGRSGYKAIWGQDTNGKDTLDIRLPNDQSSALYYEYPSNNVQNVIDWEPELEIMAGTIGGASGVQFTGYEQSTGNQIKSNLDPALTIPFQTVAGNPVTRPMSATPSKDPPTALIYRCSETMPDSNAVRSYPAPGPMNELARNNPMINYQVQAAAMNNKAVLTVFGDPGIDDTFISKMVQMDTYYFNTLYDGNNREPHWSAGNWMISGFQHIMSPGDFKTFLYLNRIGSQNAAAGEMIQPGDSATAGNLQPGDSATTSATGVVISQSGGP